MYLYKVIIVFYVLYECVICHNSRGENASDLTPYIESLVNNSGPLNTKLLPPSREFNRGTEDRETDNSNVSNKTITRVHVTSSDSGVHNSNHRPGQALAFDTRNITKYPNQPLQNDTRINDARFLQPTTSIPRRVFIIAPNFSNVSTYKDTIVTPALPTAVTRPPGPAKQKPRGLCQFCACTGGQKEIYCEHKHISHALPHILNISANIIPENATFIRFKDFERLHIEPGTFTNKMLKLMKIEIVNIPDLILEKNTLSFNSKTEKENIETKIVFENCSFSDIKSGAINQIGITNARESNEAKLNNVRLLSFTFKSCKFKHIRRNAIANARIFSFDISYSEISIMDGESIDIDAYEDFKIHHNNITSFVTNSIKIRSTHTVGFSNNDIREIQTKAFQIKSESRVKFARNTMHLIRMKAFTEIRPWHGEEAASVIFIENTIIKGEPLSCVVNKNYPEHERTIQDNRFHIHCDCNVTDHFKPLLGINENSTLIQNATFMTVIDKTLCQDSEVSSRFINIKDYVDTNCTEVDIAVLVSVTLAVCLLVLIIVVSVICHLRVKKAQDQANYIGEAHSTSSFSSSCTPPALSQFYTKQVVVPDVKTYLQTEVHFPYENAESINDSVRNSCSSQDLDGNYHPLQQNRLSSPFN